MLKSGATHSFVFSWSHEYYSTVFLVLKAFLYILCWSGEKYDEYTQKGLLLYVFKVLLFIWLFFAIVDTFWNTTCDIFSNISDSWWHFINTLLDYCHNLLCVKLSKWIVKKDAYSASPSTNSIWTIKASSPFLSFNFKILV